MNKEHFEHIEEYIEIYDQSNPATKYTPERDSEDYVYIFGECCGVVLIPEKDGRITFTILSEDDDHYFIHNEAPHSHNFWISDWINCLNIAKEYLKQHASKSYFVNTNIPCGHKLPYKN